METFYMDYLGMSNDIKQYLLQNYTYRLFFRAKNEIY